MITNVLTYLQKAAQSAPERCALADGKQSFTYAQVWHMACALGNQLHARLGGCRRRPILVTVDRSALIPAAFFGVLCSGNFYVPLDPTLPEKRLRDIYDTMQPAALVLAAENKAKLPFASCPVLEMTTETPASDTALAQRMIAEGLDTDPLYCIFTSGSTGVPKGVLISHRSVIDMAEQFTATFGFDAETVFGNQAPFDFDVSVKDLYIALRNAATVQILEKQLFLLPKRLVARLNERRVNTLIWAAAAMKILSALHTFDSVLPQYLQRVMFSGEMLPCKVLNDWRGHLPKAEYVNLYGPTEITCNCTYYRVEREYADDEILPIGKAFVNSGVFLYADGAEVTQPEQIGELCVRGTCLALGYYANPEKTAEAFCQNPLQSAYPERIYRTGDLAKLLPDGKLLFVGRADSQIKHMGHRIELGEIEVAVNALPTVQYACCLHDEARERILLLCQAEETDGKRLLQQLKAVLPDYMLPNRVIFLEQMPANRTGKIDRALLRRQYIESGELKPWKN